MGDATFRPTWQQALGRGLYLGALASAVGLITTVLLALVAPPESWMWALIVFGPPAVGAVVALPAGRLTGTQISSRGIRTLSAVPRRGGVASWNEVVDMRAELRGGRTVVSVYLNSGVSLQLQAPYSGGLFAADPRFEGKLDALSCLWRSHRFGGLPG